MNRASDLIINDKRITVLTQLVADSGLYEDGHGNTWLVDGDQFAATINSGPGNFGSIAIKGSSISDFGLSLKKAKGIQQPTLSGDFYNVGNGIFYEDDDYSSRFDFNYDRRSAFTIGRKYYLNINDFHDFASALDLEYEDLWDDQRELNNRSIYFSAASVVEGGVFQPSEYSWYLDGGDKDDVLIGYNEPDKNGKYQSAILGYAGNDYISGLGGKDILSGGDGEDTILGGEGSDYLFGGDFSESSKSLDDSLDAGDASADKLYGGTGDDDISGAGGNDILSGGAGEDHLAGGTGDDILNGGDNDDVISGDGYIEGYFDDDNFFITPHRVQRNQSVSDTYNDILTTGQKISAPG